MAHETFSSHAPTLSTSPGKPAPTALQHGKIQEVHEREKSIVLAFAKEHKREDTEARFLFLCLLLPTTMESEISETFPRHWHG
jgi:hypothetical protein